MFVDIKNNKSPLAVEVMLFSYKKREKKITPEVCMDVLKSTNYQRSIRDMLNLIVILPENEQRNFKEVVLSTFDNREQPEMIVIIGKKLAENGGYAEELDRIIGRVNAQSEAWISSGFENNRWTVLNNFNYADDPRKLVGNVLFWGEKVDLLQCDLSKLEKFSCDENAKLQLHRVKVPKHLELPLCRELDLLWMDFSDVEELTLKARDVISFWEVKNLPSRIDVSMCSKVEIGSCNLTNVTDIKFKEGAMLQLNYVTLPESIDLSMCQDVWFHNSDFSNVKDLKLKEGGKVDFFLATLPEKIDVSCCSGAYFGGGDFSKAKYIKFRDAKQMRKSKIKEHLPADWQGEIVLANEMDTSKNHSQNDKRNIFSKLFALSR